jgi:AraC family transcriptional regulator
VRKLGPGRLHGRVLKSREVSGFILTEAEHPPGVRLSQHAHENGYFCVPITGSYLERCGSQEVICKSATLAFRGAGVTHSAVLNNSVCRVFVLEVPLQWLERLREESLAIKSTLECVGGALPRLGLRLNHEFHKTDSAAPLVMEGLALEMLAEAARQSNTTLSRRAPSWLQRAREIILEEFLQTLTLAQIASEVGVHPVHLATAYRKNYGVTVGESVRRLRIDHARTDLKGNLPLTVIALRAGFADQSHFSRVFKACVGTTPSKYRRMLQNS